MLFETRDGWFAAQLSLTYKHNGKTNNTVGEIVLFHSNVWSRVENLRIPVFNLEAQKSSTFNFSVFLFIFSVYSIYKRLQLTLIILPQQTRSHPAHC